MTIPDADISLLFMVLLAVIAFLYASVGHGGASGYIALMTLFSFPMLFIKPTALVLNIFVSGVSFWFFKKRKHFKPALFYPFALSSIPAAFIGGYLKIDSALHKWIIGVFLCMAIVRIIIIPKIKFTKPLRFSFLTACAMGGIIGFFSGLIGIGGGIILTPLILMLGWGSVKEAAAVSALFIFVNSISGIIGFQINHTVEVSSLILVPIALIGGAFGAYYGSHKISYKNLNYILSAVLFIALLKLTLTH